MLKRIRKSAHHYIIKALFILLAFIFAIGLGDFSRTNADTVAKIGSHKIFLNDFLQARQDSNGQLDQSIPQEQKDLLNYSILMKMITQNLIKQEAEELGLKISPDLVVEYIKNDRNFYNNGIFDLENYKKTLEYNNLSEDKLLEVVSNQIASRFLLDSLVANLPLKSTLSDYLYNFLSEKRSISLVTVDLSKKEILDFPEQDLQDYFLKNKDSFRTKEYRSFSYLFIDPKEIKKDFKMSEDDLIQEYEENKEEYSFPETRDFHHFLAPSEEIANQIVESLKAGQNSTKLAKDFVAKKVIAEVFTNQPAQSFLSSLNLSLFSLAEDDVAPPVKSELGWHVFKILKINPKAYKNFSEAKAEIKENLLYKMSEIEIHDLLKTLEDDIASGAEFVEIAQKNNIKLKSFNKVSADEAFNKNDFEKTIFNLAFQTPETGESDVVALDNDQGYVIVKVTEIIPEALQDFAEVIEQVKIRYAVQIKDNIAYEMAQNLSHNPSESSLLSIYKKYNISSTDVKITSKQAEITRPEVGQNNLPNNFVNKLFELDLKKTSAPEKLGDAIYSIATIESIITDNKLKQDVSGQIKSISEINYKNEIYDQYINYLKNKYSVTVNFELINNYDAQ